MPKQKYPRLIALTIDEVKSQSPSVRRKVRRAFLHNSCILFGSEGRARVKAHLDQGREQAGVPCRNADNAKPNI
jgi:hypothetical protein